MAKGIADRFLLSYYPRMEEQRIRPIARNRKARHDYEILATYEAGLVLVGTEVKSLRAGKVQLADSYAAFSAGELFLHNMHISPYERGNIHNHDPLRVRKLLFNKRELSKLYSRSVERGLTLIALSVYFKGKVAKIELALARGKKAYDKRDAISERDAKREIARRLRERNS